MATRIRMFIILGVLLLCGMLYFLVMAYNKGFNEASAKCTNAQNVRILQEVELGHGIRQETSKKNTEEKRKELKKYVI